MIGVADPVLALALDKAVHVRLAADEARREKEAKTGTAGMLPPGQRYESEREILDGIVH